MNATRDSRPIHRVYVDGFFMDTMDVTNAQFAAFVRATGYVTVAERTPRAEDFPGAPPENLVAGAVVFIAPDHPVPLDTQFRWWNYVHGASWRHPLAGRSHRSIRPSPGNRRRPTAAGPFSAPTYCSRYMVGTRGKGEVSTGTKSCQLSMREIGAAAVRCALALWMLMLAATATAQTTGEIWGNLTVDWLASERLVYTLDVEPKVQVTAVTKQSRFANVDVWPTVEFALAGWIDARAEFLTGFTNEQDGSHTTEITERMGARLHILSRLIQDRAARRGAEREAQPRRRGTIVTLVRVEHRDLLHSVSPTTSSWRFRYRAEFAYPLNRAKLTSDGTLYLTSDTELFVPISGDQQQGQITQWRLRNGLGHRMSFGTRVEALYIWTTKRDTGSGHFATDGHAIDVRVKLAF
jgi:hypothetical protein